MLEYSYIISILFFIYPFVIYPMILKIILVFRRDEQKLDHEYLSDISIIISVYNEEDFITECLQSIINADYPKHKLNILIGSDGSTDETDSIINQFEEDYPFIRSFRFERSGKNNVLLNLLPMANTPLIFFMDADTRLSKDSISLAVANFSMPDTGAVIVEMKGMNQSGEIDEGFYQRFESSIRKMESDIKSTVNSLGAFYGIRRENAVYSMSSQICDDYITILNTINNGYKVKFIDDTNVIEFRPKSIDDELGRRVRVSAGGLSTIAEYPNLLVNLGRIESFFLISHKIIRYLMPYFYLIAVFSSTLLWVFKDTYWWVVAILTTLPLILHVLNLMTKKKLSHLRIFQYCEFLLTMLYGMHLGWVGFLKGRNNAIWTH